MQEQKRKPTSLAAMGLMLFITASVASSLYFGFHYLVATNDAVMFIVDPDQFKGMYETRKIRRKRVMEFYYSPFLATEESEESSKSSRHKTGLQ